MNVMFPQGYEQLVPFPVVAPVDKSLASPKISWVEEDKHNGAVNSLELASQFAPQIGEI